MKAIIVAGGKGERLRPITETIPKPMVQVNGKPILEHTIELFKKHGIKDFIIALCYLPEVITSYFGDGSRFGVVITYIYEDPSFPRGTAGAILPAKKYITDTFIVTYADIIRNLNISKMLEKHTSSSSLVTIDIYKHTGKVYKSSLIVNEEEELIAFKEMEKQTERKEDEEVWSNGSFYVCSPEIFTYLDESRAVDFAKDIFPQLLKEGKKISTTKGSIYFIDIGTKDKLDQANIDLVNNPYLLT